MALPTTNLVRHFDASANTDLFKNLTGGLLADNPADGEQFTYWDDKINTATDNSRVTMYADGTTPSVRWRDDATLNLPSIEIEDGVLRLRTQGGTGLSEAPPSATGFTILLSFLIDSSGTYSNSATKYFNCTLVGGTRNTYSGVYIRNDGGTFYVAGYNWDGSADIVELAVTPDEPHTLCFRHQGGNLYLSVDCGSEVSTASGNTTNQTAFFLGDEGVNSGTTNDFRGRIGELAVYNAGLTGTDLTDATEYFCDKWLVYPARCVTMIGENATVETPVENLFVANLDAVTRTINLSNAMTLGGRLVIYESASEPTGVANAVTLYAVDNGSGKTVLKAIFGSGAAQTLATEP